MTLRDLLNHVLDRGYFNKSVNYIRCVDPIVSERSVERVFEQYTNAARELIELPGDDTYKDHVISIKGIVSDKTETSDVTLFDGTEHHSMDFIDWNDLIDLEIEDTTSVNLSEMLAHVLYEITWWGFTRETVRQQGEDLLRQSNSDNIVEFSLSALGS